MKNTKHYLTAKRRLEQKKKKAVVLIISVLIGAGAIRIAYIGAITPIMAESYDLTANTPRNAISSVLDGKEMTIKEKICIATNGENCDVIYNLCKKESGTWITNEPPCQKYSVNKNTNGTFDYSYLQINDVHIIGRPASEGKGTITMDCVYDLYCASRWANEKIKAGGGHIWVAWNNI
ncbi:MAG: hypothetical protein WCX80_04565 [Patescibacteria group bacterium]